MPMSVRTLVLVILSLAFGHAVAIHLPGGSITWRCIGSNFHEVELHVWRECSGNAMSPQNIRFSNDCGVEFTMSGLEPVEVLNVSQVCSSQAASTNCAGGGVAGIERYTYRTTVFLSPCNSWTASWEICCRSNALNIEPSQGLYVYARLNNTVVNCDASPAFAHQAVPLACVGQPFNYDPGATDADGHHLRFRLVDALLYNPEVASVAYTDGFSGAQPYTGVSIDSLTGRISFTPNVQGYVVVSMRVDEYNAQGIRFGEVVRDFPIIVQPCSNNVPTAEAGAFQNVEGATVNGPYSLTLCAGSTLCTTLSFTDPDPGSVLSQINTIPAALPGVELDTLAGDPLSLSLCWSAPLEGDTLRRFTVLVLDDACPFRGLQTYSYVIKVVHPPDAGEDGQARYCDLSAPFLLVDSLGGSPAPLGIWTGPTGVTSGIFFPGMDPPGIYAYSVGSAPGCSDTASVMVEPLPDTDPQCILLGAGSLEMPSISLHPNPTRGPITIVAQGIDHVDLFDLHGRRVRSVPGTGQHTLALDLSPEAMHGTLVMAIHLRNGAVVRQRATLLP